MRIIIIIFFLASFGQSFGQNEHIILTEDFEAATIDDMLVQWNTTSGVATMSFSNDVHGQSQGSQSLMMTFTPGDNSSIYLYKMLEEGYDSLFARFYVKFSIGHSPIHHFVHMGGYNPPSRWPMGNAGIKPTGNDRFTTGIETYGGNWSWDFYTYWMHMRGFATPDIYYGNMFNPTPPADVIKGEWICVELMMKMNDPIDSFNGEQAFWINGEKIQHLGQGFPNGYWIWDKFNPQPDSLPFEGFQWRNDADLKINYFWLLYYMSKGIEGHIDTVYFDDVVVSTEYIGPMDDNSSINEEQYDEGSSAHPNPFSESTTINYELTIPGYVVLKVYDVLGNVIAEPVDEYQDKGTHSCLWDGRDNFGEPVGSGVYYYQLQKNNSFSQFNKILLLK